MGLPSEKAYHKGMPFRLSAAMVESNPKATQRLIDFIPLRNYVKRFEWYNSK